MKKTLLLLSVFFINSLSIYSQKEEETSLHLMFLGDIMGHGPQIRAAYNSDTKTYNYKPNYQYIKSILSKPDFTIANLEVTLGVKPYSGYPQFSSPPELINAVKYAGIDVLGTANNHSCDRRKKGIINTIAVLDSLQIAHTGTFANKKTKDSLNPLLIEKNNIKIALLNYTYGTNGIPVPYPTIVNLLNKKTILKDIAAAKKQQPDQIIAFVHWGLQYKDLPSNSQKKWFQFFKENGVNIVIGSHPHVIEPMVWNKNEKSLVVYSLGNFISNQRTFPRDGGAMFELTLSKKNNKTQITNASYRLTWVYKKSDKNITEYFVLPVYEFEYKPYFFTNNADYIKLRRYSKHARKLLNKYNSNIPENKPFTDGFLQLMQELYIPY
jgi:poly-gamma-glutamate synthesis protein (capsule biosynthesis protein)